MSRGPNQANGHYGPLDPSEQADAEHAIAKAVAEILGWLGIAWQRDPNTKETPERVGRMLVREACVGRFAEPPSLTAFPNSRKLNELICVGPIGFSSLCSHHLLPVQGKAWIGVIPGELLIGLSKFTRAVRWIMARPQMQEDATSQIADLLEATIRPVGLAVVVRARHSCMTWRGVRDEAAEMVTSVVRGVLRDNAEARAEFLQLSRGGGGAG